jgi:hypothetical protein
MARFFRPSNLDRYRMLADSKTDTVERTRVLRVLAEEWSAFTRESRRHCAMQIRTRRKTRLARAHSG